MTGWMRGPTTRTALAFFATALALGFAPARSEAQRRAGAQPPGRRDVARPSGFGIARIPLDRRPYGVTVTPEGLLYVGRVDASDITVYQLPATDILATIPMRGPAYDVVFLPDAGVAYAVNVPAHAISEIDRAEGRVIREITRLGEPFRIRTTPEGRHVFVTTSTGTLHRLTPAEDSARALQLGGVLNGLAVNEPRGVLYVSSTDGDLFEVDYETMQVVRQVRIGGQPQGIAVAPDGATLYLANETVGAQVLDAATFAVRTIPGTGAAFDVAVTLDGAELYVTRTQDGVIDVFDARGDRRLRSFRAGLPRRMAFTPDGAVLVVADEGGFVLLIR